MKPIFILTATSFLAASSLLGADPSRSKIKRFVQQVTLGAEFGSNKKVASRWTTAPTVSVFGATLVQKAVVEEVLKTLNPLLKPAIGEIQLLPDASTSATMKVYFAPLQDFQKIARENNTTAEKGNLGLFWMFWDDKNVMSSTGVLLASDRLTGNELKHSAFAMITRSLGLAQHSDEFTDSIFYARGSDGGSATQPSALDLQLIQWFHQNVSPGDNRKTLSAKFDATWPKEGLTK